MDFFQSQEAARRQSTVLVVYFFLAVVAIIVAVYLAIVGVLLLSDEHIQPGQRLPLFGWISAITALVVLAGSLYKMVQLRSGGETVARALGGRPIAPNTTDLGERRALNVVEEMAIASGIPVPPVYLLDEPGINAFAAGIAPDDAVVGVTRGCLQRLTRDELQGVIGHEFSHILNGDMRLNIRLMGVLHGILVIALIGRLLLRTAGRSSSHRSSGSKKGGNPLPLFGLALMLVGFIGVFFGKLIKSAVSRQREYLADASAVQFTRNPSGIAGALKKIGGHTAGSRVQHPNAESVSHMFFANGLRASMIGMMATHPPLAERVRRIEPTFSGEFTNAEDAIALDPAIASLVGSSPHRVAPPPLPAQFRSAAGAIAAIGNPGADHVNAAARVLASIPAELATTVRHPDGARAAAYALLLATEDSVRTTQLAYLREHEEGELVPQVETIQPAVRALPVDARLPLLDITIPALRRLSADQYERFTATVSALMDADAQITLGEYALQRVLTRHLDPHFGKRPHDVAPSASLPDVIDPCTDLLSTLAYYGHDDADAAARAFNAGFARLGTGHARTLRPLESCGLSMVDAALPLLDRAYPAAKKRILEACVATIAADETVRVEEGELLRAVADALGCPMPPLLAA
jgi:Zn-dependent protease with chaperone function